MFSSWYVGGTYTVGYSWYTCDCLEVEATGQWVWADADAEYPEVEGAIWGLQELKIYNFIVLQNMLRIKLIFSRIKCCIACQFKIFSNNE